jgi:hypothetical protein
MATGEEEKRKDARRYGMVWSMGAAMALKFRL